MPLGTPNNPNTAPVVLSVLQALLPVDPHTGLPNTQIGLNQVTMNTALIYIQQKFQMSQTGIFPAVNLTAGKQDYLSQGARVFAGSQEVVIEYYDRWDTQQSTIDTICASNLADLAIMQANLETNNSLDFQGKAYAISIPHISIAPYKGTFDTSFPGMTLLMHSMTVIINVLPYDS